MFNILTEPLIQARTGQDIRVVSLPGVYAALAVRGRGDLAMPLSLHVASDETGRTTRCQGNLPVGRRGQGERGRGEDGTERVRVFTTGGRKSAVAGRSAGAMPCRRSWTCRPSIRAGWTACPIASRLPPLPSAWRRSANMTSATWKSLEPPLGYGRDWAGGPHGLENSR